MPIRVVPSYRRRAGAAFAVLLTGAVVLVSSEVEAEERDPVKGELPSRETARPDEASVTSAFVTGAVLALASLGIGGAMAVGADSDAAKAAGIYTAQTGLVASSFVAHAMLGEWKRGVLYAILPVAGTFGMATILQVRPHTVTGGPAPYQYAFSTLMTVSVFSALLGVSDVLSFHDRTGNSSLAVLPDVNQERIGIRIGGKL